MRSIAGELIRDARLRAGMSQAELARRAGVSQPVISAYERGHREPGIDLLARFIEASGHQLSLGIAASPTTSRGLPDTPMGRRLRRHRRAMTRVVEDRGASNLRVFGSVARGEDGASSDVDLMVDLAPGTGLIGLIGMQRTLAAILGTSVDLVPAAGLKDDVREQALAEAIDL